MSSNSHLESLKTQKLDSQYSEYATIAEIGTTSSINNDMYMERSLGCPGNDNETCDKTLEPEVSYTPPTGKDDYEDDDDHDENDKMINQMIEENARKLQERIQIVREYYEQKGFRVHSGLQFGCELVLYADDPSRVHSDFCVHVVPEDGSIDWKAMQTLVRSMPDFHKALILSFARKVFEESTNNEENSVLHNIASPKFHYVVDEIALTTEHAPFRQKKLSLLNINKNVGQQIKRKRDEKNEDPAV